MAFSPEIWGTVADWVVAVTAIAGAGYAFAQLKALRLANDAQVQIARANLIREIDRDFDAPPITASRQKILALRNEFEAEVSSQSANMTHDVQIAEATRLISEYASSLWIASRTFDGNKKSEKDESSDEYALIMRLPNWCETVGHLCHRNLAPLDDILDLYDQLVIMTIGNLLPHIRLRSEAPPHKNRRYLENAVWLYERSLEHKIMRDTPASATPAKAGTRW